MREPRIYLKEAVYYATARAVDNELLFRDDADYEYFMEMLRSRKEKYNFILYSFCLLPTHYHLLMETKDKNISKIMQAINTSYSLYFNNKYHRQGHLLQGRFGMKAVNKDVALLELTYHIHLNPLKAGLVKSPEEYRFGSYPEYVTETNNPLTDYLYILSFLGGTTAENKEILRTRYREQITEQAAVQKEVGSAVIAEAEEIINQRKFKSRALIGIGSGLMIGLSLTLFMLKTAALKNVNHQQMNLEKEKNNIVSLPDGLPGIITDQNQQKQAWELWKN
jgi:REP element-mobilizing transposase RayT